MLNIRIREISEREYNRVHPVKSFLKRLRGEDDGSINVSVKRLFPGFGVPVQNDSIYLRTGIALSTTGAQTNTIPATGVLAVGTTAGRFRFKIYNGGGTSPTLVTASVTATDGTNTPYPLFTTTPATPFAIGTTGWVDRFFDYLIDTATTTAGAGGATGQLLPGGAVTFTISTTLGGTSPTASMDLELAPLV